MTDEVFYYAALQGTRQFAHLRLDVDEPKLMREVHIMSSDDLGEGEVVERVPRSLFMNSVLQLTDKGIRRALIDRVKAIQKHNKDDS